MLGSASSALRVGIRYFRRHAPFSIGRRESGLDPLGDRKYRLDGGKELWRCQTRLSKMTGGLMTTWLKGWSPCYSIEWVVTVERVKMVMVEVEARDFDQADEVNID